jgi:hypothetical protein
MDATNELGRPLLLHGTDDTTTWNDIQQVFATDGFSDLYQAYKASSSAGDAHVFTQSYEVRVDTTEGFVSPLPHRASRPPSSSGQVQHGAAAAQAQQGCRI